jgi:hypothetical protein
MIINQLNFSSIEGVSLAKDDYIFKDVFGTINLGLFVSHSYLKKELKADEQTVLTTEVVQAFSYPEGILLPMILGRGMSTSRSLAYTYNLFKNF